MRTKQDALGDALCLLAFLSPIVLLFVVGLLTT